jgi:tRNA(Ile)-lysidine synthase
MYPAGGKAGRWPAMINRVQETIAKHRMLRHGDHVLAGVSGGADSVALLHCLRSLARQWDLRITAAHLNHRLRGGESDEDEAFVVRLGEAAGIRVVTGHWDGPPGTGNLEEAARRARYEFLRRTAAAEGASRIAVGHTLDDQAETVLLRLLRGSGFLGLGGIYPTVDGVVIRPMIEVSRTEIEAFLVAQGIAWRTDSSNRDHRFLRNRIRHELLPLLREHYNPGIDRVLVREGALARDVSGFLDSAAEAAWEKVRCEGEGAVDFRITDFHELHPALQGAVVRRAIRECRGTLRGIAAAHVEAVVDLARGPRSGKVLDLPGLKVLREFDRIVVAEPQPGAGIRQARELPVPGSCEIPETGMGMEARIEDAAQTGRKYPDRMTGAVLAAEALPEVLIVRGRLPGDRYGSKKLKKLLIDAQVPVRERDSLPVVVAGDRIVWVPGFPPAKAFVPRDSHGPVVVLTISKQS